MHRYKRGDAVWLFFQDRFGYPRMHHRPAVIRKRIHPTCYRTAYVANDPRKPQAAWILDKDHYNRDRHPSDMLPHSMDPGAHLRAMRKKWREETPPETIAAWEKEEADMKRASKEINERLRPIFAKMLG